MTSTSALPGRNDVEQPRTDFRTRDLVNQAIAALPAVGLRRAASFLRIMRVPVDIAVRTLIYPQRRRH